MSRRTSAGLRSPPCASAISCISFDRSAAGRPPPLEGRGGRAASARIGSASFAVSAPSASRAPTNDPADVPMMKSALPRSTPAWARPASSPLSHAIPTGPPPPSTSARVMASLS